MPLTPNFSVAQTTNAQNFILTDTSTGSDGAIYSRQIFLQLEDGTYLTLDGISQTSSYIPFPLGDGSSISLDVLSIDYAISVTVNWINSVGATLYTKTQSFCFTENDEQFMYSLVQYINADKSVLRDIDYMSSCYDIDMFVSFAKKAVETGNDINGSQFLLDLAQNMISNQNKFF